MRVTVLVLAVALAACGGERPQGIEVTEAEPTPTVRPSARPTAPLDTVYADSGLFVDPSLRPDSLRADSLRRDSLRLDSLARAADVTAPDFRTFWPRFRAALEDGPAAAAPFVALEDAGEPVEATLARVLEGAFLDGALALTARDFRRDATSRTARVVVGYDADGNVVPQEEALTESSVTLRFDVLEGAYRLVGLEVAG